MIPLIYMGGGQFRCEGYHARRADKLWGQGEEIMFEVIEDRSPNSHRHYFARLKELWMTLPEWLKDDFPGPEELRHKMLIETGYYTEKRFVFRNNAEALAFAGYIAEVGTWLYCSVNDEIAVVRKPESQSMRTMKKKRFEQSKNDVLDAIERLIRREPQANNLVPFGQKET